ncbi:DNA replication protein [Escherichia coli]|uniref:DNA replication protein n=1 Tax=Escherichia coli TaxID=562 RepID=UPI0020933212|nr:DNA replication protein [Escherichia coli]MCO6575869.1 DNA replication protein [Escherichia coli]MCO6581024.1 DNA replication protein [Escherichia coli]MCO6586531.1 DNA replication protein [Escherichia coli]MDN9022644.1 DNA replication protein [Escherichia coli]
MSNVSNLAEAREARRLQQPRTQGGKGFALLHRKIMDVPFYKDPEAAHLWIHLLLRANHEQAVVSTDVGNVTCERGEFITGRNALASETGLSADRVKALLRKFQNLGMITTKSNNRFTVLRVVKYDEYQSNFCPADVQPVSSGNPVIPTHSDYVCPADVQPVSTDNNSFNNLLPNGNKYVATTEENSGRKVTRLSCEEVWSALKECVPDARGWSAITPKRKQIIQKFWREAKPIAKQFGDAEPFGMTAFRQYLNYLHTSCRWMFESRPDQKTGKTWQKRNYEFILNSELYAQVREGDRDDR